VNMTLFGGRKRAVDMERENRFIEIGPHCEVHKFMARVDPAWLDGDMWELTDEDFYPLSCHEDAVVNALRNGAFRMGWKVRIVRMTDRIVFQAVEPLGETYHSADTPGNSDAGLHSA